MKKTVAIFVFSAFPLVASCAGKGNPPAETAHKPNTIERTMPKIAAALAGVHRSEKNRARDAARHPQETLTFFGLRDDMTVVELWPGGGWYTEVLAPILKDDGKLVITSADPSGPPDDYNVKRAKEVRELFARNPEVFGKVAFATIAPPEQLALGPAGSADLVVTFRNLHGWMGTPGLAEKVAKASFDVLKPGGVFGVVDHRGNAGSDPKSGYVDEAAAIKLIEGVGFKLEAKSEINANPKDTKDHPGGVWALPPSLRNGDQDRAKYEAIGESDRFTLKFVKPAA